MTIILEQHNSIPSIQDIDSIEKTDDVDISEIEFEVPLRLQKTSCYDKNTKTQKTFS